MENPQEVRSSSRDPTGDEIKHGPEGFEMGGVETGHNFLRKMNFAADKPPPASGMFGVYGEMRFKPRNIMKQELNWQARFPAIGLAGVGIADLSTNAQSIWNWQQYGIAGLPCSLTDQTLFNNWLLEPTCCDLVCLQVPYPSPVIVGFIEIEKAEEKAAVVLLIDFVSGKQIAKVVPIKALDDIERTWLCNV